MASLGRIINDEYGVRTARAYDQSILWRDYLAATHDLALRLGRLRAGDQVLDAPVGTGSLAQRMLPSLGAAGRLYGVDLSTAMLEKANARIGEDERTALVHGDIAAMTFPARTFDKIFCVNALHHLPHPDRFLSNCYRMLKPGGSLILVDFDKSYFSMRVGECLFKTRQAHVRSYTRVEAESLLLSHGFAIHNSCSAKAGVFWGYYGLQAQRT